jgi:hypothetical protein
LRLGMELDRNSLLAAWRIKMRLKGRVARFNKSVESGVAVTKIGMIAFGSATRADHGRDPEQDDVVYLEIPDPEADLEPVVEAIIWACRQETLEAALASRTPQDQSKLEVKPNSLLRQHQNAVPHVDDEMSAEGQYFWNLQSLARAAALQELDSISATELKEMMTYIAVFEAKHPEKAERIRRRVEKLTAFI